MHEEASQIGRVLKQGREHAGLSQAEAARRIGIDSVTLSRYERGRLLAPIPTRIALGALYGVDGKTLGLEASSLGRVPRGTAGVPARGADTAPARDPIRALRLIQNDVEREVIQGGADELLPEVALLFAQITNRLARILGYARGEAEPKALPTNEDLAAMTGATVGTPRKLTIQELEREVATKHAAKKGGGRRRA
jgi:transcriptional regulator with XRE-family HTH domain